MPLRVVEELNEFLLSLDFGKRVATRSWIVEKSLVADSIRLLKEPWISLVYSSPPSCCSELENYHVSKRIVASEVLAYVKNTLEQWKCPLPFEAIDFQVVERERDEFRTVELVYHSELIEPRLRCLVCVTERPWFYFGWLRSLKRNHA